jgi:HEAT repeat protein
MAIKPESIDTLIAHLQEGHDTVRSEAALALVMLGEPAVPALIELLSSTNADTRMRAAWALGAIGTPSVPALIELLKSDDKRLRTEAIRILGVIGASDTLNHLMQTLTDSHTEIAARSARAIGRIGDPRAFHALTTALQHPSPDVRYEACRALANLGLDGTRELLLQTASTDTGITSWGASVAEIARRSAESIPNPEQPSDTDAKLVQLSKQLQRQLGAGHE